VTYEGIVGAEIAEFWPDIMHHFTKKHQEKLDKQAGQPTGVATAPVPTTPNPPDQKPQDQTPQ
jgi:hypothetical protein